MQSKYPVFVALKIKSIKCQAKKPGNEATMPFMKLTLLLW